MGKFSRLGNDLYTGRKSIDFVGKTRIWYAISGLIIVAAVLGLSTLIDLAVFFWFTHPMVSWLARFDFFNKGHKLSGLDHESLGIDRLPMGGKA